MYSPQVLDHFQHPRNAGGLDNPDAHVRVENPVCGDILELFARMQGGRIIELRFKSKGCVPAMACGSLITEMAAGRTTKDALSIDKEKLIRRIGGLPAPSGHAAQLAVDALRELLRKLQQQ
jgi:nitrogen fixation NifU-like protein